MDEAECREAAFNPAIMRESWSTSHCPLLVSTSTAKRLLDIRNTKFWALVKAGKIEMVDIGVGRRMVRFSSLQALIRS